MADMLRNGTQWLAGQLTAHASRAVTYRRGAAAIAVSATVGKTAFQFIDHRGFHVREESRDYLIDAALLAIDGQPIEPQRGDKIFEGNQVYEVMAPNKEPLYRYLDTANTKLRIHTLAVGNSEAHL